ncbi:hypothetical protein A9Q96_11705 [Rhodobacterales bacterium 52_120_T64]|nr:hypothetical protein A9Q96_11705 [Rhodobacterales bacterium 52_120_T64]
MFEISPRAGQRPQTTPCAPHEQVSQNPDAATYQRFKERAFDLPFVERRPSMISVPGAEALWLPHDHAHGCKESFMLGNEFAHVHPHYDGSMHLMLPISCTRELFAKGWGEPHPMAATGMIPETAVMVFAPRNEEEIETALKILATSYDFALGKLANPASIRI